MDKHCCGGAPLGAALAESHARTVKIGLVSAAACLSIIASIMALAIDSFQIAVPVIIALLCPACVLVCAGLLYPVRRKTFDDGGGGFHHLSDDPVPLDVETTAAAVDTQ